MEWAVVLILCASGFLGQAENRPACHATIHVEGFPSRAECNAWQQENPVTFPAPLLVVRVCLPVNDLSPQRREREEDAPPREEAL